MNVFKAKEKASGDGASTIVPQTDAIREKPGSSYWDSWDGPVSPAESGTGLL